MVSLKSIIIACCANEEQSRKFLYGEFYTFVMGVVVRYIGATHDAEELVNDSFIKIFRHLRDFDLDEHNDEKELKNALRRWMARISSRTALDFIRIAKNNRRYEEITELIVHSSYLNATSKIEALEILGLLDAIPQTQKLIFNLYEIDGYSHKEISEILNISERQSSVYLGRAKNRLRNLYLNAVKVKEKYDG